LLWILAITTVEGGELNAATAVCVDVVFHVTPTTPQPTALGVRVTVAPSEADGTPLSATNILKLQAVAAMVPVRLQVTGFTEAPVTVAAHSAPLLEHVSVSPVSASVEMLFWL